MPLFRHAAMLRHAALLLPIMMPAASDAAFAARRGILFCLMLRHAAANTPAALLSRMRFAAA